MLHHALLEGEVEANGHEDLCGWKDESFVFDQTSVADFRRFLSQLFGGFLSKDSKVCLISDMCRFLRFHANLSQSKLPLGLGVGESTYPGGIEIPIFSWQVSP